MITTINEFKKFFESNKPQFKEGDRIKFEAVGDAPEQDATILSVDYTKRIATAVIDEKDRATFDGDGITGFDLSYPYVKKITENANVVKEAVTINCEEDDCFINDKEKLKMENTIATFNLTDSPDVKINNFVVNKYEEFATNVAFSMTDGSDGVFAIELDPSPYGSRETFGHLVINGKKTLISSKDWLNTLENQNNLAESVCTLIKNALQNKTLK